MRRDTAACEKLSQHTRPSRPRRHAPGLSPSVSLGLPLDWGDLAPCGWGRESKRTSNRVCSVFSAERDTFSRSGDVSPPPWAAGRGSGACAPGGLRTSSPAHASNSRRYERGSSMYRTIAAPIRMVGGPARSPRPRNPQTQTVRGISSEGRV